MLPPPIGLGHSFVVFPIGVFHDCADMDESGTLVRVSHEVVEMDARAHFDSEHDDHHGAFGLESLREESIVHALDAQQHGEHEDDTTSYEHRDHHMDHDPWGAEAPQTQGARRFAVEVIERGGRGPRMGAASGPLPLRRPRSRFSA